MIFKYIILSIFYIAVSGETFLVNPGDSEYSLDYITQDYEGYQDLDPISFKRHFEVHESLLELSAVLDGQLKGFTDFSVQEAALTPDLKLNMSVTLKNTVFSGSYNVDGLYYKIIPLKGNGNFWIELKNFHLELHTMILPNNGSVQLKYFNMNYSFDDIKVLIDGITGEPDVGKIIQLFVEDFIPNALSKHETQIVLFLSKLMLTSGNEVLKDFTPRRMIELIKVLFVY